MSDYNLTGLNPRDFEHLIQSLAMEVIASGVTPFGDGPDGGREATYNGKMAYPSSSSPWDGYLVIQAKFNVRPTNDSTKDGDWALNQLKTDLAKFENPKRNLPKPDYYLFVTNVVLTPIQDTGSKDKAFKFLEQKETSIGLKGYDIWDFDKICRLLDGHSEIRNRYAAFITPGDILAEMMQVLKAQHPDFLQIMSLFLQNELRADQFVKLEQAGRTAEHSTSLAQVFVDLPVFDQPHTELPGNERELEKLSRWLVKEILDAGLQVLKRSKFTLPELLRNDSRLGVALEPGRFVVVGGPGQGKSTIGQFICQLYRAALLKDRPSYTIVPEVMTTLSGIIEQCGKDEISLPVARRFPVRVVLEAFATDLANNKVRSLLSFILERINHLTNSNCSVEDLRRWLGAYPWLIILDGLDEVPATSNRKQVLEKVVEFWTEVANLDADVLVVATTRPQGYNDEFSPRFYHHRYLAPLSKTHALHYASRLAEAKYGNDPDRKTRVLMRLAKACEEETTLRLMRSPLQITIMATLVDQIGQPPQERWRLFQQYYEVIYRRETERDIPASRILQQRKADVNAIHYRVGLLLQTENEKPGKTESWLSVSKFNQLVQARIAEEGYEGEQLELRTKEITEAALQRLVFLVGLEEDRIGFEIRSLQEFMAAEALMDGREGLVRERLETIAPIDHWRNVFLFAAGKCFAEREFLRDMIITICDQLNDSENDKVAGATLAGSRLALDILDDGVAREKPNYLRSLARIALRLLELPDTEANSKLAAIYDPQHLASMFRDALRDHLGQINFYQRAGAWVVLRSLADRTIPWAEELADTNWPEDVSRQLLIMTQSRGSISGRWSTNKMIQIIPKTNPQERFPLREIARREIVDENAQLPEWYTVLSTLFSPWTSNEKRAVSVFPLQFRGIRGAKLIIRSIFDPSLKDDISLKNIPFINPEWAPVISIARFNEQPSPEIMSRELHWLSQVWKPNDQAILLRQSAWPFAACLLACKTANDLKLFADRAENGQFGQVDDWIAAEKRWAEKGVTENDLIYLTDDRLWPYDDSISEIGFPFSCSSIEISDKNRMDLWNVLWEYYNTLPTGHTKLWFSKLVYQGLRVLSRSQRKRTDITPRQIQQLLTEQSNSFLILDSINFPKVLDEDWLDFLEWLGNQSIEILFRTRIRSEISQSLVEAYIQNPTRSSLLNILSLLVIFDCKFHIPESLLVQDRLNKETLKISALNIQLAQGKWSVNEVPNLAKRISSFLEKDTQAAWPLIYVLHRYANRRDQLGSKFELLALAVRDELIANNQFAEISDVIDVLSIRMRTRTSQLGNKKRWGKLGLPVLE